MKKGFVEWLRCPKCHGELSAVEYKSISESDLVDGLLTCACGARYLVHQGVPRMLPLQSVPLEFSEAYKRRLENDAPEASSLPADEKAGTFSFSHQWSMHSYNELTWELTLPERVAIVYRYLDLDRSRASGLRLLDAGCGNGTLSAALAEEGLVVSAMDFSTGVYRAHQRQLLSSIVSEAAAGRLDYVHGDVMQPPFAPSTFDLIFSDGVLHHTRDTRAAFMALAPLVKPGGRFFVWLYRRDTPAFKTLKNRTVDLVRFLTRPLSYRAKTALCRIGACAILSGLWLARLLGYRGRRMIPLRLKTLNLFDTISPQFNHEHTTEEVAGWFREAGFKDVRDVNLPDYRVGDGVAVIGTK